MWKLDNDDIYFDDLKGIVKKNLSKAKETVKIAVAWINFDIYFDVFKNLLNKKVKLKIVITDEMINRKWNKKIEDLIKSGAKIKYIKMPSQKNYMHHKFCIIDKKVVLIGSYNWSKNADKNFENLLVLKNSEVIIKKLNKEFNNLYRISVKNIREMQLLEKCENCKEKMVNLLVLKSNNDQYYTSEYKVLEVCGCGFNEIANDIDTSDTELQLRSICNKYEIYSENEEEIGNEEIDEFYLKRFEEEISSFLSSAYKNLKVKIHAIGILIYNVTEQDGDGEWMVKVMWKQRFVSSIIEDYYDDDFGMI